MALKALLDTLDGLDAGIAGLYSQREDGKFILGVDDAEEAFAPGLTKNRDEILKEKKALEEQLKLMKDVDAEEYVRLKKEAEEAARKRDEEAGNWRNLEKQLLEKHNTELGKRDQRIEKLGKALNKELVESKAAQAIAKAKGVPTLLLPHVSRSIKVVENEQTGDFTPTVIDPVTGQTRIGDTKGTPMTIEQLVEEMRTQDVYSRAFEATGAGGSGSQGGGGGAGAGGVKLTREQARDTSLYRQARERAEKSGTTVQIID